MNKNMNKKIYLVAILSVLLLTISVVAVTESVKKEVAPGVTDSAETGTPIIASNGQGGRELTSPSFHETTFTSSTNLINIGSTPVIVLQHSYFVPTGGAELTATFSAETNTGPANTLAIQVLDISGGVTTVIPPGTVFYDQNSEEDGWQAHSFTFGKTLTSGFHTIRVNASGTGTSLFFKSLTTEIEELP